MRALIAVALWVVGGAAQALPVDEAMAQAEQAEQDGDAKAAVAHYEEALRLAASTPIARTAQARLDFLRSRSEGDFAPLGLLLRMQHTPFSKLTLADLAGFEKAMEGFPPGAVRRAARAYVAGARQGAFHDFARAEEQYRRLLDEPGLDAVERESAAVGLSANIFQSGRSLLALSTLRDAGFGGTPEYRDILTGSIRELGRPVAVSLIALFLIVAGMVLARSSRLAAVLEALSQSNLLFVGYVVIPPALLAWKYSGTLGRVFVQLDLSLAPIVLLAFAVGAALRERPTARGWQAMAAAAATGACVGAGFLALARSEMLQALLIWRGL